MFEFLKLFLAIRLKLKSTLRYITRVYQQIKFRSNLSLKVEQLHRLNFYNINIWKMKCLFYERIVRVYSNKNLIVI